jgi:small subunit ribosomal protein S29
MEDPSHDPQSSPLQSPETDHTVYDLPKLTAELLQTVLRANEIVLKKLPVAHNHDFANQRPSDLYSLAEIGAKNTNLSWSVWQAFWKELTSPCSHKRPPVLFSIDSIEHWMTLSKYRTADYRPIHAHQLLPISHFLSVLFTKSSSSTNNTTDGAVTDNTPAQLANGGLILAATSASNSPSVPTFTMLVKQIEAITHRGLKLGDPSFPMHDAYATQDPRVTALLPLNSRSMQTAQPGVQVQRLRGLERDVEARGLLEHFARSGLAKEAVSEAVVAEKWTLAGGGVVGELARFGKRLTT